MAYIRLECPLIAELGQDDNIKKLIEIIESEISYDKNLIKQYQEEIQGILTKIKYYEGCIDGKNNILEHMRNNETPKQ